MFRYLTFAKVILVSNFMEFTGCQVYIVSFIVCCISLLWWIRRVGLWTNTNNMTLCTIDGWWKHKISVQIKICFPTFHSDHATHGGSCQYFTLRFQGIQFLQIEIFYVIRKSGEMKYWIYYIFRIFMLILHLDKMHFLIIADIYNSI